MTPEIFWVAAKALARDSAFQRLSQGSEKFASFVSVHFVGEKMSLPLTLEVVPAMPGLMEVHGTMISLHEG